jgi:WG containing repeat
MKKILLLLFTVITLNVVSQRIYQYDLFDKSLRKVTTFTGDYMEAKGQTNDNFFTFKSLDEKWNICTMQGRILSKTFSVKKYQFFSPPNEYGHCIVRDRKKQLRGVIDTSGNVIIPVKYESLEYSDGMYRFDRNFITGYLDSQGNEIISPKYYITSQDFSNGFALVAEPNNKEKFFFINKQGKNAFEGAFTPILPFSEGLAAVKFQNEKGKECFGYINTNGQITISFADSINMVGNFINGMAYISTKNKKQGFIDKTGKIVIPCIYDDRGNAPSYIAGEILVAVTSAVSVNYFTLSKKGEIIGNFLNDAPYFNEVGYAIKYIKKPGQAFYGLVNEKNEIVMEPKEHRFFGFTKNNIILVTELLN